MRQRRRGCFYQSHACGALHRGNLEEACRAWLNTAPDAESGDFNDDVDAFAEELAEFGVPDDELQAFRKASYDETIDPEEEDVYVFPVNSDAVRVFCQCRWQRTTVSGPGGSMQLYDCIAATEIEAVANVLRIPDDRRERMLTGVRIMEQTALPILNRNAS